MWPGAVLGPQDSAWGPARIPGVRGAALNHTRPGRPRNDWTHFVLDSKAEINALCFATRFMARFLQGWDAPLPIDRLLGGPPWSCSSTTASTPAPSGSRRRPPHRPILWRHVSWERHSPGPRGQGADALGMAVLSGGQKTGQAVPPTDEPGSPRPPPGTSCRPTRDPPTRSSSAAGPGQALRFQAATAQLAGIKPRLDVPETGR